MAGRDKRGPEGKGPMTGRGLGYCAGSDGLGYELDRKKLMKPVGSRPEKGEYYAWW